MVLEFPEKELCFNNMFLDPSEYSLTCMTYMIYINNIFVISQFLPTGTSGDTGSAAIESVKPLSSVDIIVLLPKDRCTQVQERQMTTVITDNVHIYRGKIQIEVS